MSKEELAELAELATRRRLQALCGAIELVLPEPWRYFCVVAVAGGEHDSINVVSNATQEEVNLMLALLKERFDAGERPEAL